MPLRCGLLRELPALNKFTLAVKWYLEYTCKRLLQKLWYIFVKYPAKAYNLQAHSQINILTLVNNYRKAQVDYLTHINTQSHESSHQKNWRKRRTIKVYHRPQRTENRLPFKWKRRGKTGRGKDAEEGEEILKQQFNAFWALFYKS